MSRHKIPEISPIIERWHPRASNEDKKRYTRDLRRFVAALFALNERLEAREREERDSRESEGRGNLDSR